MMIMEYHIKALLGFVGAGASLAMTLLAEGQEMLPSWIMEGGAYVAFVSCLIYACVTLWKANLAQRLKNEEVNESHRAELVTINEKHQTELAKIYAQIHKSLEDQINEGRESKRKMAEALDRAGSTIDSLSRAVEGFKQISKDQDNG